MIRLVYSNRTERLADTLVEDLRHRRGPGAEALVPVDLVVPNRNMETYLRFRLAEALGVAANLRFYRLERFIAEVAVAADGTARLVDSEAFEALILAVLLDEDALASPELAPVRSYLEAGEIDPEGADLRRAQLAARLAHLFEEYSYSRGEMLRDWKRGLTLEQPIWGELEAWQRCLWRRIFGRGGLRERHPPASDGRWLTLEELLDSADPTPALAGRPVLVFGLSYVARVFQRVFARIGEVTDLHLYTLNPCMEFWEDIETEAELRRRLKQARAGRKSLLEDEDPYQLFGEQENPALRLWGRPGRENICLLNELTDCDFEGRFEEPLAGGTTLLRQLQHDILHRHIEPVPLARGIDFGADETLQVLACPGVRREVEVVADEIWRLLRHTGGEAPLRLSDIAVIVNRADLDTYLPHIEATFEEFHQIPRSVGDIPLAAASRLVEAAGMLLELPFGRFSRPELLRLMTHPAVMGSPGEVSPDDWLALADALGIVFGADASDHAGTYIDHDVLNWDQGIKRLVLGAFMTGARSGDNRLFELGGRRYPVAELGQSALPAAARFGLLARSLIADARWIRQARLPLAEWAARFRRLLGTYLAASEEEGELLRCLGALARLEAMDLGGAPVSGRLAAALAREALASLSVGRGSYLAEGVAVSSFLPMRAIPFRAVFILGLGQGHFPAPGRRHPLDLRQARRRAGDVNPAERDRYMFLETLLSARDRLYLSYVSRDEQTGEKLEPASVVQELLHILREWYVRLPESLERKYPLRRSDEGYFPEVSARDAARPGLETVAPGAHQEACARALGRSLQRSTGRADAGADLGRLHRLLPGPVEVELARLLQLSHVATLPETTPRSATSATLSLSLLRGFLECPLQGSATAVLGLEREEDQDLLEREEEWFTTPRMDEVVALRQALLEASRGGVAPEATYAPLAERLELEGRMPTGILGRTERRRHGEILAAWDELLRRHAGSAYRLVQWRLGRASEHETADEVSEPLVLEPAREDAVPVELHGRTQLLLKDTGASVLLDASRPGNERRQVTRVYRYALRGFVDHLLLCALGHGQARQVLVAQAASRQERLLSVFHLPALRREEARAYLGRLAGELLERVHDYLLPCEAVFEAWRKVKGRALNGGEILQQIERCFSNEHSRCSSHFGPVPHPERYRRPQADEALAMAERRLGLFLRSTPPEEKTWGP